MIKQRLQDIEQIKRQLLEAHQRFIEAVQHAKAEASDLIDRLDKKYDLKRGCVHNRS